MAAHEQVWRDVSSINRLLKAHLGPVLDVALSGGDQLVCFLPFERE